MIRLGETKLFSRCARQTLELLASIVDIAEVEPGTALIRAGGLSREAYVVESGTAEVIVNDKPVGEIGAGEIVGEIGLLDQGPPTALVRAKTDMTVLVIPHNRFAQIAQEVPGLGLSMARELAHRLRSTNRLLH